jgi:predicted metalloprotease
VRVELQADCFAGVWAYHTNQAKQILEQGDVESALAAASAIGDDALQRQSRGEVVPDSFTHGTSAQRVRWFTRGIETGSVSSAIPSRRASSERFCVQCGRVRRFRFCPFCSKKCWQ